MVPTCDYGAPSCQLMVVVYSPVYSVCTASCTHYRTSPGQYSRGYKKRAIVEKMFETLVIFSDSLKGYFPLFFIFLLSKDS
jgi:hypothetical protein